MSEPYVIRVTFKENQVLLTVQVDDFPSGALVEISGYATQEGGGFASFYGVQAVVKNPDDTAFIYAAATPTTPFKNGEAVTVVLRAARVWATVITEPGGPGTSKTGAVPDPPARDGTTWNVIKAVTEVSAGPWYMGGAGPGSVGDASFPTY
jgi:hypothetical protein